MLYFDICYTNTGSHQATFVAILAGISACIVLP